MNNDELLIPRVKITNWYPGCPFSAEDIKKGVILTLVKDEDAAPFFYKFNNFKISVQAVELATANFRILWWWEERKIEDLPMYIRFGEWESQHRVYKIIEWNPKEFEESLVNSYNPCGFAGIPKEYFISLRFPNNFPATEEEYFKSKPFQP